MLNQLWWALPNKLAGMRKPENLEEVYNLVPEIGGIISLLDDTENHSLYTKANMPFLWLPISGGRAPTLAQVSKAIEFIATIDGSVAVHCSGGRKRTATTLAAILANEFGSKKALQLVLAANSEAKLNDEQRAFVENIKFQ